MITRREAIQRVAVLLGASLSTSALAGLAGGCAAPRTGETYTFRTLDEIQRATIDSATERIIPATDTPGANGARVTEFIDTMLSDWYRAEERTQFLNGLAELEAASIDKASQPFADLSEADQIEILRRFSSDPDGSTTRRYFQLLKELTMVGYYTSEIGMTVELQHEEVPGVFEGCVPLEEVGRAWA